jgi:NHS family xanthosine MFS transporter
MLFALIAWVLRYGFFAYGSSDFGVFLIVMSCIVYGMAFDFFLISGSMFVENNTDSSIRSSAQGLFIMMTNGIGAYIGTVASSALIGAFFILPNGNTDWNGAWLLFAAYSLVVAILFMLLFKEKPQAA